MTSREEQTLMFLHNTRGGAIIGHRSLAEIVSEGHDIATMTNPALAVLVVNYVWRSLRLESPESVLLAEVIARLRDKKARHEPV
jgi:hypothetical protein